MGRKATLDLAETTVCVIYRYQKNQKVAIFISQVKLAGSISHHPEPLRIPTLSLAVDSPFAFGINFSDSAKHTHSGKPLCRGRFTRVCAMTFGLFFVKRNNHTIILKQWIDLSHCPIGPLFGGPLHNKIVFITIHGKKNSHIRVRENPTYHCIVASTLADPLYHHLSQCHIAFETSRAQWQLRKPKHPISLCWFDMTSKMDLFVKAYTTPIVEILVH